MNAPQLGDRYRALLQVPVREEALVREPRHFTELELQAHWFAGDFGREFVTTDGTPVRIVQFGTWNREAGPDFAEAAVSFDGGDAIRGCVELDPDARDWERHGHASNPAYESVVLHVFTRAGDSASFTRTLQHRQVPQVRLDLDLLGSDILNPQPEAKPGRCVGPLQDLPEAKVREVILGAAQCRLQRKSAALARLRELHGPDEALFQSLAATLGYKSNKLPFTLLAQRLPQKLLRRHNAEALLFGVSGFLPAQELGSFDGLTRSYLRELWEAWWPKRADYERVTIAPNLWKFAGQRPVNHPQRRLAALAEMVRQWPAVRALSKACDPQAIQKFFAQLSHPYWDFHYTVSSKASPKQIALVGEARVTDMLVNVFLPLAISKDKAHWETFASLPAPLVNRRAQIAALRLFADAKLGRLLLRNAAMQQGLLQIYDDFCMRDVSDCQRCLFPAQLSKW